MAGICGVASKKGDCSNDLFWETFYLQHRAQDYCGLALSNKGRLYPSTHKGLIRPEFPKERLKTMEGEHGIGVVASDRQPVSELGKNGLILGFDGNITNNEKLKNRLIKKGFTFSGYHNPEEVSDSVLVSKIIAREPDFVSGVESLVELMEGDFSIVALTKDGIYAARGWGRKPLILGQKDEGYAVSSESNSFVNTGFKIVRDVTPGEIVLMNKDGVESVKTLDLSPIKFGTFEWIYTAYPASVIDGMPVSEVRKKMGSLLMKRYPVEADVVSPVPNSGRWHAIGTQYAKGFNLPYEEVFVRYDYSDRSYTQEEQEDRDQEGSIKLIPVESSIRGKKIIIVDDSIVRGTQTLNQVDRLKNEFGAEEVHARIACPPLMHACSYGKTTKEDKDCIARRMSIEDIQKKLLLNSLGYATVDDLEKAIGMPRSKLCLECWAD